MTTASLTVRWNLSGLSVKPAAMLILPRLRGRGTTRSVVEGANGACETKTKLLRRRFHPRRSRRRAIEHGDQPRPDRLDARRALDLLTGEVGHVESVDHLLAEGGDMGRGDVE